MGSSNTLLWVVLAGLTILAVYYYCGGQKDPIDKQIAQLVRLPRAVSSPRPVAPAASVEHDGPLLASLFAKEDTSLPAGVSKEEFDRLVAEYKEKYLTEAEVQVPRNVNFNYQQYTADQAQVEKEAREFYQRTTDRETVGSLSERAPVASVKLHVKNFQKKRK